MASLKCCVIIPTYNNFKTLRRVIDGVLSYTSSIIIVNDGATDSTSEILEEYAQLTQLSYAQNKGKGYALKLGFKKALSLGYEYAITIDSDGQHYPDDLVVFIEEIEKHPNSLLVGARNMDQDSVPKGSSFGHKFSNFWYWAETGVKLTDTQSGYRLYPISLMENIPFYTNKFEFEIENIVKASWRGVRVANVPVKVLYDPLERVSHFRPYKDFARITLLNIYLLIIAFFYIKPRDLFRTLKKKGFKKFFVENIIKNEDSPLKKSSAIALGVFIGIAPFWGFQGVLAILLATIFKLNKTISFAFSNISIPPVIPVIIFASFKIGDVLLGSNTEFNTEDLLANLKILTNVKEYVLGSFVLATSMACLAFGISLLIIKIKSTKSV
ncbi:MAG: DUF2062 domain-containing protein [Flavobacteriaceae bacterium]|nr:DUF2062 domain-containing protein [Flavobacteriaceae bacterium]